MSRAVQLAPSSASVRFSSNAVRAQASAVDSHVLHEAHPTRCRRNSSILLVSRMSIVQSLTGVALRGGTARCNGRLWPGRVRRAADTSLLASQCPLWWVCGAGPEVPAFQQPVADVTTFGVSTHPAPLLTGLPDHHAVHDFNRNRRRLPEPVGPDTLVAHGVRNMKLAHQNVLRRMPVRSTASNAVINDNNGRPARTPHRRSRPTPDAPTAGLACRPTHRRLDHGCTPRRTGAADVERT